MIRIADYDPRWRADFARLNIDWLERFFVVEDIDRVVLSDPEAHILAHGGRVLFAIDADDRAIGTVALKHEGDGVYELTKMAVDPGIARAGHRAPADGSRTRDLSRHCRARVVPRIEQ